jgi:CheY-like chemotaxis protein
VLVADDHKPFRDSLCRCLKRAGFRTVGCHDGAEAIVLLRSMDFDFLITDLKMPHIDGIDLLDWVRRNRPHMRAVVVTAYGGQTQRRFFLQQGVDGVFEKPFDPEKLAEYLRQAGRREGFVSSFRESELLAYLRDVSRARRSLVLDILDDSGEQGRVYMHRGRLKHAEGGGCEGVSGLLRCLAFSHGIFKVCPWTPPQKTTIREETHDVLCQAVLRQTKSNGSVVKK